MQREEARVRNARINPVRKLKHQSISNRKRLRKLERCLSEGETEDFPVDMSLCLWSDFKTNPTAVKRAVIMTNNYDKEVQPQDEVWLAGQYWKLEWIEEIMKSKWTVLSRLTKLIKPDRCRLHQVPLVESNPVVKAGRHQPLWQLHLRLQAESWMEVSAVDTFNLLKPQYAPLRSIILSVTAGCRLTNPDSRYVLSSLFHLKCNTHDLPALFCQPYPHANVSLQPPPWQGSGVIRQHQPSSVSVKWGRLGRDSRWHVSSHRAWVFSAKTSHNAFKEGLILPAFQFKWRLKSSRHMSRKKRNFLLWLDGKWGHDVCQTVTGCEG